MPKRKKRWDEMTTDEMAKKLFPKKAVDKLREAAHEHDDPEDRLATDDESDATHGGN